METVISLKIFTFLTAVPFVFPAAFGFLPVADHRISAASKYQIECTMCSACDNPCSQYLSPPPSPTVNYQPPPSPPTSSNYYYYSPPPPQPTYTYSSPPPPGGIIGGYYQPPPYRNYPAPPPPNPIVSYFPFYYHTPPPGSSAPAGRLTTSLDNSVLYVTLFAFLFALF